MPDAYNAIDASANASRPLGRKRKRVSVACRPCRSRKSRCNGANPCSTCEEMEVHCQYDLPCTTKTTPEIREAPVDIRNDRTTALEQRLQDIERRLASLEDPRLPNNNNQTSDSLQYGSHELRQRSKAMRRGSWSTEQETPSTAPVLSISRISDQSDGVDGMGSVALREGVEEDEYFGNSSNVAFLRSIVQATVHSAGLGPKTLLEPGITGSENPGHNDSNSFLMWPFRTDQSGNASRRTPIDPFALPPKYTADDLLHLYFNTVNLMIPCIHEASFRQTLFRMRTEGPENIRRSWLGVLNMMFAITTNVMTPTSPTQDRAQQSNTFYERAMELVSPGILGRPSVEMVSLLRGPINWDFTCPDRRVSRRLKGNVDGDCGTGA
ncbi:uncharacterized protein N7496_000776 [Penicillium cataractarum]|uniref:Zn(2)-C6 fungal-type domain-containing protein n=1 Tax=Penicillium cataractarum TaxID=2100454 RepID=A0A9W9VUT6_9EURO|nr:uncharacterized protein N7496_000776 [Penicillium cataractarum]KAJ5389708.1 hypothetical protein N7496_000776 [Penicillium cataractarum]